MEREAQAAVSAVGQTTTDTDTLMRFL